MDGETGGRLVGGRYRLDRPLGGGAMGTVWRAHDTRLGRDVAVKEVTVPASLPEPERRAVRERTFREARVAARLHHPSAVAVYDVVEADGQPCLVMELVEARTLAAVVRDGGPLSPTETARVGLALLGALEAAHAAGVLHRDVKPGNVLLTPAGRVVLSDFGIATSPTEVRVTSTGLLLGSPAYIAPERARGRIPGPPPRGRIPGPASDLWSLGATLYACVEGRPPFDGDDPLTTLAQVVSAEPEPPRAAGPLAPALLGLLEKDPERRLGHAAAREALLGVLGDPAGPDPARGEAAPPAGRRGVVPAPRRPVPVTAVRSGVAGSPRLSRPEPGRAAPQRRQPLTPARRAPLAGARGLPVPAPLRGALVALALATAAIGGFALQRELGLLPPTQGPAAVSSLDDAAPPGTAPE